MALTTFQDYVRSKYPEGSGTVYSYIKALQILDDIFRRANLSDMIGGGNNLSLSQIKDPVRVAEIIRFVAQEEDKFRHGQSSIFDYVNPNQTSYPRNRFCTAAIRQLGKYVDSVCAQEASLIMNDSEVSGEKLSIKLRKLLNIDVEGTEMETQVRRRVGQEVFRSLLLDIYHSRCCLTGIDVPEVLRASHIIPWSESKTTRLNLENGLCLSATYDAAFDRHLISFDEDYRLILSPTVKEAYTSASFNTYFRSYEGQRIEMPSKYLPSQKFLQKHRDSLV